MEKCCQLQFGLQKSGPKPLASVEDEFDIVLYSTSMSASLIGRFTHCARDILVGIGSLDLVKNGASY